MLLTFLGVLFALLLWAGLCGLGGVMTWRGLRGWPDPTNPTCRQCGYGLAGLPQHRCPECGTDVSLSERVRPGRCNRSGARELVGVLILTLVVTPIAVLSAMPVAPPVAAVAPPAPAPGAPARGKPMAQAIAAAAGQTRWEALEPGRLWPVLDEFPLETPTVTHGIDTTVLTDVEKRWVARAESIMLDYTQLPQRWTENAAVPVEKPRRRR